MALSYTTALKNARLDLITSTISTSGKLIIYDGTPPATASTALSGNTALVTLNLSSTFAPGASGGVLTASAITATAAAATGTASFYRLTTSASAAVVQGSVGAGSGDLSLSTVSITSGTTVSITAMTITAGN